MSLALKLAEKGRWSTHPNPRVGCVLVRDGRIVGDGWHQKTGSAHAEINALQAAGELARGATAYVTLEPCCHQGRTGPCTSALTEAGVSRVVAAMLDPNPAVSGKGIRVLAQQGIETTTDVLAESARKLNTGFCSRMLRGRPWVRAKLAMSLDGRTAMESGESKWITGTAARRDVQRLRAESSAVMTGIGTVLADDPSLNVRAEDLDLDKHADLRQPLRVIADSKLRIAPGARILGPPGKTLILCGQHESSRRQALSNANTEVAAVPGDNGRVALEPAMRLLADREMNDVLLECGATLAGAMIQAAMVDEIILYAAPVLLGDDGRGLVRLPGLTRLREAIRLDVVDVRSVGEDIRITCRVRPR